MKKIKSVLSLLTITVMVFCLGSFTMSVSASEYTITVTNSSSNVSIDGKEFSAYKIFALSYDAANEAYLYTVENDCVATTEAEYISVAQAAGIVSGTPTFADVLDALSEEANARKFADEVYNSYIKGKGLTPKKTATATADSAVLDVEDSGYYLVFGTGDNTEGADGKNTVTSLVMLDSTAKSAEINVKLDAPTLTKEIKHNESDLWGAVGDNQIGDDVEYRYISTIPDLTGVKNSTENDYVNDFSTYVYEIHDTMSEGLTFNDDVAVKYVKSGEAAENALDSKYVTTETTGLSDGETFVVKIDVLSAIKDGALKASDTLYTYYSAKLNTSALVAEGDNDSVNHNDNTAYLKYSNNPYDNTSTGETTKVTVYDWTFRLVVNKTAEDGTTALKDAVFNIKIGNGDPLKFSEQSTNVYVLDESGTISDIKTDTSGTFTILGLDDDTVYTLVEKEAPAGYNKAEDQDFKVTDSYADENIGNTLTSFSIVDNGSNDTIGNPVVVKNSSGQKLVATGGIGTTIFYISGGVIMVIAAVALVVKKRMSK